MSLPPNEQDLHAWLDGEADATLSRRIEDYLVAHPQRAEEVEGWRRDAQLLRQAMPLQRFSMAQSVPQQLRRRVRQQRQWKLAGAFALIMTLGVGGYSGWQLKDSQLSAQRLPMEDAVQAYKLFGGTALASLDISASQQQVVGQWMSRYFINGNVPPNLEQFGFKQLGARLMATEQGPSALVMYQNPQGLRVAWYIRPIRPLKLPHGQRQADELIAQYWSDNHYNYALVSPMSTHSQIGDLRKAVALSNS
ncbi:anti-sigma factor [[Pantoea] beijingensis]|uniref:Anti-sigma factor n=1 Tax=[Pantoea] beijingensis TaxID=1324864 RepID=A0A443IA40_9GAMM|nr:anti-sigma factor [[Pantoea] beijingensis]RWR00923.1 anti-sigma factor [[Pantoea] beijingensis]